MIRKLMASSAVLALMTAGAITVAQAQTEPAETQQPPAATQDATQAGDAATTDMAAGEADATLTPEQPTIATAFIGRSVYSSEDPESDNIGEVNDLIIGDDGMITHAVVGVGGFLGIGEKDVAVPFNELQVVEADGGEIRLIYAATKEQLEAAEEFDRTAYDPQARAAEEEQAAADAQAPVATAPAEQPADTAVTPPAEPPAASDTAAAPAEEPAATDMAAKPADAPADAAEKPADTAAAPAEEPAASDTAATPAEEPATDMAAAPAPAEDQTAAGAAGTAPEAGFLSASAEQVRATTMIGKEVFGPDDTSIGEVSDIVLQEEGGARAALIDVGGFLGVGEKEVAIPFDKIEVGKEGDEVRLTLAMTKEELEQLPAFEDRTAGSTETAEAPAAETAEAPAPDATAPDADVAAAPDATAPADGAQPNAGEFTLATQDLSADALIGAAVYSPNEENIGEVGDVIFDKAGDIEAVVVDVGGFLGVGEKPVAVQFDALNVQKDMSGDMRLMVNATQEQLESAPSYETTAAAQ